MTLVLYYAPATRATRVRWLLEELAVPYQLHRLDLAAGEHRGPAYRAINPLGKVPALVDDGVAMFESGAILAYLADRFPERGLAPLPGTPQRAAYLQWLFFVATTFEPPLELGWKTSHDDVKAATRADFAAACAVLEATLADGRPFLLGDQFSAADVAAGSVTGWARTLGALATSPFVLEYGRRVGARPAARAARAD